MEPKVRRRARASVARRGLKEAQSKDAGRRTETRSEVWYIRDELARDNKVLHPQWGVLYKSGVYASKVTCLTPGGLPYCHCQPFTTDCMAEGRAIDLDRMVEVSRRHSRHGNLVGMEVG